MNDKAFLIITSIAPPDNKVLNVFASECLAHNTGFIVIGDTKSPKEFKLANCDFYSIDRQSELAFKLARSLPVRKYSRKNLGYLLAMKQGAEIIIETDDDNFPADGFWDERARNVQAYPLSGKGWVNIYRFFTQDNVWPRGFALEHLNDPRAAIDTAIRSVYCPIQQGLSDGDPDVDAIFKLTSEMPVKFDRFGNIALVLNTWCPFNSQNTTWFREAFPLLYLPSHCSFRMTDIWRGFVAQRVAWTNDWSVLFHKATVFQERNEHDYLVDFKDEVPGYLNNGKICNELQKIDLEPGPEHIFENILKCYDVFISHQLISPDELPILNDWIDDCSQLLRK